MLPLFSFFLTNKSMNKYMKLSWSDVSFSNNFIHSFQRSAISIAFCSQLLIFHFSLFIFISRVMFNNFLTEKISVYVGVNFGGGNLLMSQHLLNHTYVGTSLQEVCSKRMTKHVGTDFLLQSHRFSILSDIVENGYTRDRFSTRTDKNNIFTSFFYGYLITVWKPIIYFLYSCAGNWNQPLLTPLTFNAYKTLLGEKIGKTRLMSSEIRKPQL